MSKKALIFCMFANLLSSSLSYGTDPLDLDDKLDHKLGLKMTAGAGSFSTDRFEIEEISDMGLMRNDSYFWKRGTEWERQGEFNKLFNKLRLQTFSLRNNTEDRMEGYAIAISLYGKGQRIYFSLEPGQLMAMEAMERYLGVCLDFGDMYLNLKSSSGEDIEITGDRIEEFAYPRPFPGFDFTPQYFEPTKDERYFAFNRGVAPLAREIATEQFMKDYDRDLNYLLYALCPGEGIDPLELLAQRQRLYDSNNPNKFLVSREGAAESREPRIPHRSHRIWFTSERKPNELPDDYIHYMLESASVDSGWESNFWILNPDDLPKTMEKLAGTSVNVREIRKALPEKMRLHSIFEEAVAANKFGQSSDIARMEILKQGGVYEDTDYRRHQSFNFFAHHYDFVAGLEPMSNFLGNAFIAASPEHPVVHTYLDHVETNYDPDRAAPYIKGIPSNDGFKTILLTGPGALTTAFYKGAGRPGKIDIAAPPMLLYPALFDTYPQKRVVTPVSPMPIWSLGAHYWDTAWMRFGSKG